MGNSILKFHFKTQQEKKKRKFSRSYPCLGKKDSTKHKQNLTLIAESSEEDEPHGKPPVLSNVNGVKKNGHNPIQADYANHQGHYRQLSRDRKLPPVPDAEDFHMSQQSTYRQLSYKLKKNIESTNFVGKDLLGQNTEGYGSIVDSETYGESKNNTQSPFNPLPLPLKMMAADEMKDMDPLYAIVIPQQKRNDPKDDPARVIPNCDHDSFLINHLNDHGYSIIIKKTPLNEFSSLRKPDRSRALSREQCHQSLQSLSGQAPGLPVRLYNESDIFHLRHSTRRPPAVDPDVRIRDPSKSSRCSSSSIRRFSQPLVPSGPTLHDDGSGTVADDPDVLKSLQSCFNTPPVKRASVGDLYVSTYRRLDNEEPCSTPADTDSVYLGVPEQVEDDSCEFYRRITVRESLASLRERNALPDDSGSVGVVTVPLQHGRPNFQVYEGFYETLYYSSADNGRAGIQNQQQQRTSPLAAPREPGRTPGPSPQTQSPAAPAHQASQERLPFLNQDNYLSITENPLGPGSSFPGHAIPPAFARHIIVPDGPGSINHVNERSSVVYTGAGSEIYAEISDVYLSKQYEELPAEAKQVHKSDGGQVNNGFVECSSPGSVRVMLEIQSFRHMDSDVDISSRCTTPLHPFGKAGLGAPRPPGTHWRASETSDPTVLIRHPWYLPQKTAVASTVPLCTPDDAIANSDAIPVSTATGKPFKVPQNSLVVMTPLMERSMEDAAAFALQGEEGTADVPSGDLCGDRAPVRVLGSSHNSRGTSSLQTARWLLYPPFHESSDAL